MRPSGRRGLPCSCLKRVYVGIETFVREVDEALPVPDDGILQPTLLLDAVCLIAQGPGYGSQQFQFALTGCPCQASLTFTILGLGCLRMEKARGAMPKPGSDSGVGKEKRGSCEEEEHLFSQSIAPA